MKRLIENIQTFFERKRKYSFDDENFVYKKERFISRTTILLITIVCLLVLLLGVEIRKVGEHEVTAQKHFETVKELREEISSKEYMESELELYAEIGQASLEKDCGECNEENICAYIDYLAEMGVAWHPEILKACCKLESNFGESNVAKKYNNLFGMDHPRIRKTLSLYPSGRFATFKNWKCSILDRILWDYANFEKKPTRDKYYGKMVTKYNTELEDYESRLRNCENKAEE